jgi:hypothetical protein
MKATDIENTINTNNLPFALSKNSGKKWVLTNTDDQSEIKFDNLAQVDKYLSARIGSGDTVKPEDKQGASAVKIDTSKIVLFASTVNAPIPSAVVDKTVTAKLQSKDDSKNHQAVINQFKIDLSDKGKPCLPEELQAVANIKSNFKKLIDKLCLQFSVRGNRAVSVHHRDQLEAAKIEANSALIAQAQIIAAKLDDWKEESIAQGRYVEGKWPSASYFIDSYRCDGCFSRLDGSFDYEQDLIENAIGKVKSEVQHALESVSAFINGDAKKFRENSIANVVEAVTVLKESGIVSGDTVDQLVERIEGVATEFDAQAIRDAKTIVEKGVVVPVQGKRGRKASPVTKEDVEAAQKLLDEATDPFAELAEELEGLV